MLVVWTQTFSSSVDLRSHGHICAVGYVSCNRSTKRQVTCIHEVPIANAKGAFWVEVLVDPLVVTHPARDNLVLEISFSLGFAGLESNHVGFFHDSMKVHKTSLRLLSLKGCVKGLRSNNTTSVVVERLLEDTVRFLRQERTRGNTSLLLLHSNLSIVGHREYCTVQCLGSSIKERKLLALDSLRELLHCLGSNLRILVECPVDKFQFLSKLSVRQTFDNFEDHRIPLHVAAQVEVCSLSGFVKTVLSIGHLNLKIIEDLNFGCFGCIYPLIEASVDLVLVVPSFLKSSVPFGDDGHLSFLGVAVGTDQSGILWILCDLEHRVSMRTSLQRHKRLSLVLSKSFVRHSLCHKSHVVQALGWVQFAQRQLTSHICIACNNGVYFFGFKQLKTLLNEVLSLLVLLTVPQVSHIFGHLVNA